MIFFSNSTLRVLSLARPALGTHAPYSFLALGTHTPLRASLPSGHETMRDIGIITQWTKHKGRRLKHHVSEDGTRVLRCLYGAKPGSTARHNDDLVALKRDAQRNACVRIRAKVGMCPDTNTDRVYYLHGLVQNGRDEFLDLRTEPKPICSATTAATSTVQAPATATSPAATGTAGPTVISVTAPTPTPVSPSFVYTVGHAGYVYVVKATTDAMETYYYVGETANTEDPLKRIRQHFESTSSAILKRIPSDERVIALEHTETHTVPRSGDDAEARAAAELDKVISMMKQHGPKRVRGAHFLENYGRPLNREQQMLLQQRLNQSFS